MAGAGCLDGLGRVAGAICGVTAAEVVDHQALQLAGCGACSGGGVCRAKERAKAQVANEPQSGRIILQLWREQQQSSASAPPTEHPHNSPIAGRHSPESTLSPPLLSGLHNKSDRISGLQEATGAQQRRPPESNFGTNAGN